MENTLAQKVDIIINDVRKLFMINKKSPKEVIKASQLMNQAFIDYYKNSDKWDA